MIANVAAIQCIVVQSNGTRIDFIGDEEDSVVVKETIDNILAMFEGSGEIYVTCIAANGDISRW